MGSVAKWKGKALQMLDHRFKSGRGLQSIDLITKGLYYAVNQFNRSLKPHSLITI